MSKFRNIIFGCAMSLASAVAPMSVAEAMPLGVPKVATTSDVTKAQVEFCVGYGCDRPRYYQRRYYREPYYGERRYYRPRYERPRYRPQYQPPRYSGRRSHTDWCLSRYRTYDPYTNRYHAGGGIYRQCYSPYR